MMRKHPNQFLTGFDIGEPGSLKQQAEQSITAIRAFLGTLPKNLARKVARENAVALLAPAIKNNQQLKADRKRTRRPAAESFPTFLYAP
jgi:hypothetical protein